MTVPVLLRLRDGAQAPAYAKPGDAGADLAACQELTLAPGQRALVPTGVMLAIPDGFAGLVHPRSGLAARHGITIVNAPGTIDSGYRGEIMVNLINLGHEHFVVRVGDRIAQLLIVPVSQAQFISVDSLPESDRGETGHGSSGGFVAAGGQWVPTEVSRPETRPEHIRPVAHPTRAHPSQRD